MQTVFKGKICDLLIGQLGVSIMEPGILFLHVRVKFAHYTVIAFKEVAVLDEIIKGLRLHLPEENDRVVGILFPGKGVNLLEKPGSLGVAYPPQIVCKICQPFDAVGQVEAVWNFSNDFIHH